MFAVLGVLLLAAISRLMIVILRGQKLRAPRALEVLASDERAPVVLLRSFDDDDLIDPSPSYNVWFAYHVARRYEDHLVKALRPIGPARRLVEQITEPFAVCWNIP